MSAAAAEAEAAALPLAGVRVVEVGTMIAAPYAAGIIGDLGASVIKIESPAGDALRQSAQLSGTHFRFNEANRNKYSVCLDLAVRAGQSVFRRLVSTADVVICNLRPDVLERLGLDYESLRESNDAVISVRLSAFGATGPHRLRRGTAPTIDGASGLATLNGYPGAEPLRPAGFYPDLTSALFAVYGVLAALRHRDRTGEGQEIDIAMTECVQHLVSEAFIDASLGAVPAPQGNADPDAVPSNCYLCAGDDVWIAISVESEADWAALSACMGNPGWADAPEFATTALRRQHETALDQQLGAWTAAQDGHELLLRLRGAGLAAALVARAPDVLADPQLAHRGYFRTVTQPGSGTGPLPRIASPPPPGLAWSATPAREFAADNDLVFRGLVGLDAEAEERLYAERGTSREMQDQRAARPGPKGKG